MPCAIELCDGCQSRTKRDSSMVLARRACRERNQRQMPCALDGDRQQALMAGARARLAARPNLAAFVHEAAQQIGLLVIDALAFFDPEPANLGRAPKTLAHPAARSARARAAPSAGRRADPPA